MGLPKIDLPLYELELPSTGEKVKYRPFTVKEEKILLTAQETKDANQIFVALKQIVSNCIQDHDVESMPLFDIEYLMINIRAKSIDNEVSFEITDPETQHQVQLKMDLNDVKVYRNENHENKIQLNDSYFIFMRYPTIDEFLKLLSDEKNKTEKNYDIMISCMDKLASEDEVYKFSDFSKQEIDDFIESLNTDVTKKIKNFFDTLPRVRYEIPYVNSKGNEKTFIIQGTETFFM